MDTITTETRPAWQLDSVHGRDYRFLYYTITRFDKHGMKCESGANLPGVSAIKPSRCVTN